MKKVLLTSILLLSVVSFGGNVYAQDVAGGDNTEATTPSTTQPSVTFKADGNTLTISGHGDLTSYSTKENQTVFSSEAKGKINTQQWGNNVDLSGKTYDASATYYYLSGYNWVKIEDNKAYFAENSSLLEEKTIDVSFVDKLAQTITSGNYEIVKFENNSSDVLTINSAIIGKVLFVEKTSNGYTWTDINENLKELDLGQAICTDLSSETFSTKDKNGTANLTTLTLPLTVKTSVKSESTSTMVEKMVLPSNVLGTYYPNITTVTIPKGYDRLGDRAFFERTKISTVNLPSTLTVIGNSAFQTCSALASIELNEGLENIGKEAFNGTALTSIKFPSSLKIINDAAFFECKIYDLKFNAGLKYIGNAAFAFKGNEVKEAILEIPASVRYIGPFAFAVRYYQDIYFYGDRAPMMPSGKTSYIPDSGVETAFSEVTYMGNNGFNEGKLATSKTLFDAAYTEGYANRENYKTGGVYFTMLHYPKGLTDTQSAAYTDITRVYRTNSADQTFRYAKTPGDPNTFVTVGSEGEALKYNGWTAEKNVDFGFRDTYLGEQYVWPGQEQWRRSYVVNSLGYNWNGVDTYRPKLDEGDLAILAYAGYKIGTGEGEYSEDELSKIAHLGTRKFVLVNADANVDTEEEKEPEYKIDLKPGQWWTLCVPFNMTKKQVLETFGEDTQLCLFSEVERHTGNGHNSIVLKFTQDVLNHSTTDSDGNKYKCEDGKWLQIDDDDIVKNDDEVVVWAHESYMIKPMKGKNSDKEPTFVVKNYTPVVGNPLPTVVEAQGVKDPLQEADYSNEYRFIGNYLGSTDEKPVVIPQYSYIYAKTGSDPTYKFRFYTGTKATWSPNKSIVQSHDRQGGYRDYKNFFGSDKRTWPQSAKQASIFGEEDFGETTGIDNVTIIAGSDVLTPIFTLDGKMVSVNGSVEGLAKGVYVKAGKKFVVK